MISIIVPTLNEQEILQKRSEYFEQLSHKAEVIFVDGGSTDQTVSIVQEWGMVVHSQKGRAIQMNCAAKSATQDALLFLHADTSIDFDDLEIDRPLPEIKIERKKRKKKAEEGDKKDVS